MCGAVIYAVPAAIRIATGSVILPVLSFVRRRGLACSFLGTWLRRFWLTLFSQVVRVLLLVKSFFQVPNLKSLWDEKCMLPDCMGLCSAVAVSSLIQLSGGILGIAGSWGGNLFEYPSVFPLNFLLASLSIFTPTILSFFKNKIAGLYHRLNFGRQR